MCWLVLWSSLLPRTRGDVCPAPSPLLNQVELFAGRSPWRPHYRTVKKPGFISSTRTLSCFYNDLSEHFAVSQNTTLQVVEYLLCQFTGKTQTSFHLNTHECRQFPVFMGSMEAKRNSQNSLMVWFPTISSHVRGQFQLVIHGPTYKHTGMAQGAEKKTLEKRVEKKTVHEGFDLRRFSPKYTIALWQCCPLKDFKHDLGLDSSIFFGG